MSKILKQRMKAELVDYLQDWGTILFVEFHGLTAGQSVDVRNKLRESSVAIKVVKNSLATKALADLEIEGIGEFLDGPTAIAVGAEDGPSLSKAVTALGKEWPKIKVKGGITDGKPIGPDVVEKLSKMPTRDELLARVAGCFQAPVAGVGRCINDLNGRLARVLKAVHTQMEEEAG